MFGSFIAPIISWGSQSLVYLTTGSLNLALGVAMCSVAMCSVAKKIGEALHPLYKDLTGTSLGHKFLEHEELGTNYVKDAVGHERYVEITNFNEIATDPNKLQTIRDLLKVDSEHTPMMGMVDGNTVIYLDKVNRLIVKDTESKDVRKIIFGDETEHEYTFTIKTSQYHTYGTISDKNSEKEYHFGIAPKSSGPLQVTDYAHLRDEKPHQLMYHKLHKGYNVLKDGYGLFDDASMEVEFELNYDQLHKMHEFLDSYQQRAKQNLEGYNLFNKNCASFMSKVFQHVYDTDIKPSEFYKSEEMDLRDKGVFQQFVASRPWYTTVHNSPAIVDLFSDLQTGKGIDEFVYRWTGFIKHHTDKLTKLLYGEEDSLNELFYHAASDDVTKVAEILEQHPDLLNASDKYGYTALHYALDYLCPNTAVYLIESGADLNAKDIRGFEALQKIFTKGFIGNFWQLEPYLDQHYKGSYDTFDTKLYVSPLLSSALANEPEIIQWLVEHGSDVFQTNTEGFNAAHTAAKAHNVEAFEFLKTNHEELLSVIDKRYLATPEELFDRYNEFATERATLEKVELLQAVSAQDDQVEMLHFEAADQDQTDEMFQHIELPDSAVAA
jgi:hypothetical protein